MAKAKFNGGNVSAFTTTPTSAEPETSGTKNSVPLGIGGQFEVLQAVNADDLIPDLRDKAGREIAAILSKIAYATLGGSPDAAFAIDGNGGDELRGMWRMTQDAGKVVYIVMCRRGIPCEDYADVWKAFYDQAVLTGNLPGLIVTDDTGRDLSFPIRINHTYAPHLDGIFEPIAIPDDDLKAARATVRPATPADVLSKTVTAPVERVAPLESAEPLESEATR